MLTEQKLSLMVHQFHNGGISKSATEGLTISERNALVKFLLNPSRNPACYCINCL